MLGGCFLLVQIMGESQGTQCLEKFNRFRDSGLLSKLQELSKWS